jgi:hypothetical protein
VLIGASDDAAGELGIELDTRDESAHDADLFRKLRLPPDKLPLEPLEKGVLR